MRFKFICSILLAFLLVSVYGVGVSAGSIPSSCHRPPTSFICNSYSILSNETCDSFDRTAEITQSYILNDTYLVSLYAEVVLAIPRGSDDLKLRMRGVAEDTSNQWDISQYQKNKSAVLILASLNDSAVYFYSPDPRYSIYNEIFSLKLEGDVAERKIELGRSLIILSDLLSMAITGDTGHPSNHSNTTDDGGGTDDNSHQSDKYDGSDIPLIVGLTIGLIVGLIFIGICLYVSCRMIFDRRFMLRVFHKQRFIMLDEESGDGESGNSTNGTESTDSMNQNDSKDDDRSGLSTSDFSDNSEDLFGDSYYLRPIRLDEAIGDDNQMEDDGCVHNVIPLGGYDDTSSSSDKHR
jgi:hypothetical protein